MILKRGFTVHVFDYCVICLSSGIKTENLDFKTDVYSLNSINKLNTSLHRSIRRNYCWTFLLDLLLRIHSVGNDISTVFV